MSLSVTGADTGAMGTLPKLLSESAKGRDL